MTRLGTGIWGLRTHTGSQSGTQPKLLLFIECESQLRVRRVSGGSLGTGWRWTCPWKRSGSSGEAGGPWEQGGRHGGYVGL